MAEIPGGPHSWQRSQIESMIAEGRVEEAMQKLTALLETGDADRGVQAVAARWILALGLRPGDAKALRSGGAKLRDEWMEIAEMVRQRQEDGATYANAVRLTAEHFSYSERHVQSCVADYNAARTAE
ncbi:MAG: hypothetical protein ABS75_18450 [Pelagibacterium sp. SCN 63-23]|nr:MAG: hypothetical protein ABS75_18450 [Pelagibacterium sp. SCN 63-23]